MAFIERPYQFKEYPKLITVGAKRVTVKNADEEAALLAPNVKLDPPVLMVGTEPVVETEGYNGGIPPDGLPGPQPEQSPDEQEAQSAPAAPVDEFKGLATNQPTPVLQTRAKRQAAQQAAEAAKARKK